jgi:hypothetical protein
MLRSATVNFVPEFFVKPICWQPIKASGTAFKPVLPATFNPASILVRLICKFAEDKLSLQFPGTFFCFRPLISNVQ